MKISCQSCQAKYTIADEKVVGKLVKIRCKKCSATIVVNGNELAAGGGGGGGDGGGQAVDWAQGAGESWTVNVADGDQRTMTAQEIADGFRNGLLIDETYCWRDGMADWLPLREIEPLWSLANAGPRPSLDFEDHGAPASLRPPAEQPSAAAPLFGASEPAASGYGGGGGYGMEPAAAARRTGGRAQGADLFAGGGGEDDGVMTSAAAGMPGGGGEGMEGVGEVKLTGARNENSVLFSLSALTNEPKKASEPEPKFGSSTGTTEGSGLIDIRQLAQSISDKDGRGPQASRVDDIMNLSGGGAFGAALAAPILAPPPLEMVGASDHGGGQQKGNKALIFAILGGCGILGIAIVAAVALTRSDEPKADGDKGSPTSSAVALNTPPSTPDPAPLPAAPSDPGSSGGTVAPPPTGANTAKAAPAAGGGGAYKAPTGGGGGGGTAAKAADPTPAPAPAAAQPKSLAEAMAQSASSSGGPAKAAGGGGSTQPFDRGAAQGSLSGVNVQSCKKPDGPTGSGHVYVTFQPDGSVQKVEVDAAPYAGTPVGACVAGKFRGAHVPAFAGGPVRVGKGFTIN